MATNNGKPQEVQLRDGAVFMRKIAERMEVLAREVEQTQGAVADAEEERDAATEALSELEQAIEDLRLDLLTPEELIERVRQRRTEPDHP